MTGTVRSYMGQSNWSNFLTSLMYGVPVGKASRVNVDVHSGNISSRANEYMIDCFSCQVRVVRFYNSASRLRLLLFLFRPLCQLCIAVGRAGPSSSSEWATPGLKRELDRSGQRLNRDLPMWVGSAGPQRDLRREGGQRWRPESMPERVPEDLQKVCQKERVPEGTRERMPERVPEGRPEDRRQRMSEKTWKTTTEDMPEDIPEERQKVCQKDPERVPQDMPDILEVRRYAR